MILYPIPTQHHSCHGAFKDVCFLGIELGIIMKYIHIYLQAASQRTALVRAPVPIDRIFSFRPANIVWDSAQITPH